MEWVLAAVASVVIYSLGRARGWWPSLMAAPTPAFTCDIETDMPDQLKQIVLAQVATQKSADVLNQMAASFMMGGYVSTAYCLRHQAWVLGGSQGAPPPAPTAADIAAGQALRAQQRAAPVVVSAAQSGQTLNAYVGQTLVVQGLLPYDPNAVPDGFAMYADTGVVQQIDPLTFMLMAPTGSGRTVEIYWGPGATPGGGGTTGSLNVVVAAAAPVPGPAPAPATATVATPASVVAAAAAKAAPAVVTQSQTGWWPGHGHMVGRDWVGEMVGLSGPVTHPHTGAGPARVSPAPSANAWSNDPNFIGRYQAALMYLSGVLRAPQLSPGVVDGKLTKRTHSAVLAFQRTSRLPVTGRVDNQTAAALDAATTTTHAGAQGATMMMRPGMQGEEGGEMTGYQGATMQMLPGIEGEEGGEMTGYQGVTMQMLPGIEGEEGGEMTGSQGWSMGMRPGMQGEEGGEMTGAQGATMQMRPGMQGEEGGEMTGWAGPVVSPPWSN